MALQRPVSAIHFRPEDQLVTQADQLLEDAEGAALEELTGRLYEETSRKGLGDFPLSERIKGYWDRAGIEIDLVAVSESTRRIRFGTCKRNPDCAAPLLKPLKLLLPCPSIGRARHNGCAATAGAKSKSTHLCRVLDGPSPRAI